jgi:arylsulfatase A-like enzyme
VRSWRLPAVVLALAGLALAPCGCGKDEPPPSPPPARRVTAVYGPDGVPDRPPAATPSNAPKGLVWICLDTVRADAFEPWAAGSAAMPKTSAWLARNAVAFHHAASTSPWTGPSIASLLTGLLPSRHGARELSEELTLVPAVATMAEILHAQGFHTAAYTGGGWLVPGSGILQGVDLVELPFSFKGGAEKLLAFTRAITDRPKHFVFLHTYEAHDPYLAPPATPGPPPTPTPLTPWELTEIDEATKADGGRSLARRFLLDPASRAAVFGTAAGRARIAAVTRWFEQGFPADPQRFAFAAEARSAYTQGLERLDDALAGFLAGMESAGLLDGVVLVLSSDHGEGFGEHQSLHHGRRLYDELIRVPLYVRAPGWPAGTVVEGSCSLADVFPTVLELFGLPGAEGIDGESLVPLVHGSMGRPVRSEERRTSAETGLPGDQTLVCVRDAMRKWIATIDRKTGAIREEAYNLAADPREERPLPPGATDAWPAAFRDEINAARHIR